MTQPRPHDFRKGFYQNPAMPHVPDPQTPRCADCKRSAADWHEPVYRTRQTSGGEVRDYVTDTVRLSKRADGSFICNHCSLKS